MGARRLAGGRWEAGGGTGPRRAAEPMLGGPYGYPVYEYPIV